tara:strand:- start:481 stop:1155 length:675 start_codon:yes stop_codon:yes gene_type:complete
MTRSPFQDMKEYGVLDFYEDMTSQFTSWVTFRLTLQDPLKVEYSPFSSQLNITPFSSHYEFEYGEPYIYPLDYTLFNGWKSEEITNACLCAKLEFPYRKDITVKNKKLTLEGKTNIFMDLFVEYLNLLNDNWEEDSEYGIFSWAESTGIISEGSSKKMTPHKRICFKQGERPQLLKRSMYPSQGYVSKARKLNLGLVEKQTNRTVVWLSESERQEILKSIRESK